MHALYTGYPEDGTLVLQHVGILYIKYRLLVILCAFVGYWNYL